MRNKISAFCNKISMRWFVFFLLICTMIVIGNVIFDLKAIYIDHRTKFFLGKNLIFLTICFWGYSLCIWKKRKLSEKTIEKRVKICIQILAHMCFMYLGILFVMSGISVRLYYGDWSEITGIIKGSCFLLIAVIIWFSLLKNAVYLWYPVSCYCALYTCQAGDYVGGMEGVGAVVALFGGVILFGIIEYSITVFLNLGIPKWIWKYVCGLVLFIILVLLHFA